MGDLLLLTVLMIIMSVPGDTAASCILQNFRIDAIRVDSLNSSVQERFQLAMPNETILARDVVFLRQLGGMSTRASISEKRMRSSS